jgi:RNA-directed DNA polymerase
MAAKRQNPQNVSGEQNHQLELPFTPGAAGEAPSATAERVEAVASPHTDQSQTHLPSVMQEVLEPANLGSALRQVQANKGSPGIDGMTVGELPEFLRVHWPQIRRQLQNGTYKPLPVRRVEIPKPDGGTRKLGVPSALDRFIQQAVAQVLCQRWDPTFSDSSYGFRPGRSAHQAVEMAQCHITSGHAWVVDIDLEKFFDKVNHDKLMGRIMKRETDKTLFKLIRAFLNAGVMENGLVGPTDEGVPQGGPLSPLLSNLVLDELDKELEKRSHKFVRYADDCNIYVQSQRAGQRVMEGISRFIADKLKLKVNSSKSAVDRPSRRKFLGFSFTGGKNAKRRIAPRAIDRFKERIRELTRQAKGQSLRQMVGPLAQYLRGWRAYFGINQTSSVVKTLDEWIRRRLRGLVLRHWKTGRRRFAELRKRGVGKDLAAQTAGSCHGPWRLAKSPALSIALPNRFWDWLGIPRVAWNN